MDVITILQIVLAILVFIIFALIATYALVVYMNKRKEEEEEEENLGIQDEQLKDFNGMPRESIYKFMEFDEVKDNMIIRKNRTQYIMILQCSGVNYDLMSEDEKIAVEEGFVQFLNTLQFPIQLYVQTRSLNLRDIVDEYKAKVSAMAQDIEKVNARIQAAKETKNERLLQKLQFEKRRKERVLDYGMDIAEYVARMSLNKNVLQQRTYLILSYYSSEAGATPETTPEEIDNLCFSELYTRAQSVVRTLGVCGINARVMTSNELVELLYMAYNRDEAEVYGLDKALKAGYDELYSTAPDVVDKQMKALDKEIEQEALEKAKAKVTEARSEKQKALQEKKNNKRDLIDELAKLIIEENTQILGADIAQSAIEKVDKEKEEGGTKDNVKKEKTKRTRKTKTA